MKTFESAKCTDQKEKYLPFMKAWWQGKDSEDIFSCCLETWHYGQGIHSCSLYTPCMKSHLPFSKHLLGRHCRNRPFILKGKILRQRLRSQSDKWFSIPQGLAGDLSLFPPLSCLVGNPSYTTLVHWVSLSSFLNRKGKCALEIKIWSLYKK